MLFVFESAGFAVVGNDDQGTTTLDASITATLVRGSYTFAISSSFVRPLACLGLASATQHGQVGSTGDRRQSWLPCPGIASWFSFKGT